MASCYGRTYYYWNRTAYPGCSCNGNGKIFTVQDESTFVSAIGVSQGRIAWTGDTSEIEGEYTDIGGKTVFPGFIDSHIHPVYVASVQDQVACMPVFLTRELLRLQR